MKYSTARTLREIDVLAQKVDSLVLTTHKILLIDCLEVRSKYFAAVFRSPFDVVGPRRFAYNACAIIRP